MSLNVRCVQMREFFLRAKPGVWRDTAATRTSGSREPCAPSLFPGFLLDFCWKDAERVLWRRGGFGEGEWRKASWKVVEISLRDSFSPNP